MDFRLRKSLRRCWQKSCEEFHLLKQFILGLREKNQVNRSLVKDGKRIRLFHRQHELNFLIKGVNRRSLCQYIAGVLLLQGGTTGVSIIFRCILLLDCSARCAFEGPCMNFDTQDSLSDNDDCIEITLHIHRLGIIDDIHTGELPLALWCLCSLSLA